MKSIFLDQTKCELGEGPTYDPQQNKAWWFDIVGKKLFEHDFTQQKTTQFLLPVMASMLAVVDDNTQLIAAEDGLYLRDCSTNKLTLHHPLEADNGVTRSNDGRAHPCGAIWIGTMGKSAEKEAGAIYHFHKGTLTKLFDKITIPNAICFSPDRKKAYFTDTNINILNQIDIDPNTALPIGKPTSLYDHSGKDGGLDGAVTDAEGNIWIACWGASALYKISALGDVLEKISLTVTQPTCPCFVGKELDQLLVTSAWQGKPSPANIKGDAGKTCLVQPLVKGKPEPRIAL
ncbi:MAG: SMP-30/gluconolactonase/LRE family protein [Salaquimonas sp.]